MLIFEAGLHITLSYSRLCRKIQCTLLSYKITIHIYSSLLTCNNKNNLKKNTLFLIIKKLHGSRVGLLHSSDVAWTVCLNKAQDKRSSTLATMNIVVNQEQFSLLEKKVQQTQTEKISFYQYGRTKTCSTDGGCYQGL